MFLMLSQVKKSGQSASVTYQTKKHQYFSIVSLPTDSVIVDHDVLPLVCQNTVGPGLVAVEGCLSNYVKFIKK
jgi:hypothetical protein